ncbi:hypothetical protein GDO78_004541 [Eleutherodactylus coqui]|uniref:SOCS box domain-containing protein n=1 Tax=Eleutherodactylus coqui TaxID=57060 RepID=A0A8J6JYB1_ELECQ|nr:hypothetical protein GDO78_004541 [Eleutherodactylus coqui]
MLKNSYKMAKETFPFSSATLRSLQQQREQLEDEERRRAVRSHCLTRRFLPECRPSNPPANRKRQYCRDAAIHNALYTGDVERIKGIFKEDGSAEVLVETVTEELQWSPEMGLFSLIPKKSHTSPLRITASRGYSECLRHLICRGANPNTLAGGRGALHDSCEGHHTECTQLLLSRGADPNLQSEDGQAPLHLCTTKETLDLRVHGSCHYNQQTETMPIQLLLDHGASVNVTNSAGYTPLDCALQVCTDYPECQPHQLIQALLNHGAAPPSVKMWRCCAASPLAFEILLNSYDRIPPGDFWVEVVPTEIWEEHLPLYESALQVANQPRRLQHLARCAVRELCNGQCHRAIPALRLPAALAAYLLLLPEGLIH